MWRAAKNVTNYREPSSSEESEDDFEPEEPFPEVEAREEDTDDLLVAAVGGNKEHEHLRQVDHLSETLGETLTPPGSPTQSPRAHFSPVHVPFPINQPEIFRERMANENFEDENGTDTAGAFQQACTNLKGYEWNPDDLDFYFNQVEQLYKKEIALGSTGI